MIGRETDGQHVFFFFVSFLCVLSYSFDRRSVLNLTGLCGRSWVGLGSYVGGPGGSARWDRWDRSPRSALPDLPEGPVRIFSVDIVGFIGFAGCIKQTKKIKMILFSTTISV